MAMSLGGVSDSDQIGPKQLHAMAEDLGVRPNVVMKSVATLSEQLYEAIPETASKFSDMFGNSPVLERIRIIIRKQIRRLKTMLRTS
jgi:hypothetical protein